MNSGTSSHGSVNNSRTSQHGGSSTSASQPGSAKKPKAPQPTVVWGICGVWQDPNHFTGASTDEAPTLVSVPPSQVLDTAASRRYFQSTVQGVQPICVAFHVGACGAASQCEQLHVQRQYLAAVLANKNACCGACGDAFTNQLLADVPDLDHLLLDLVVVSNSSSIQTTNAFRSGQATSAAQFGAPGRTAPATDSGASAPSSITGLIPALVEDSPDGLVEMPPLVDFEFDTSSGAALDDPASRTMPPARAQADASLASLAGDSLALAQLPVMRQIKLVNTCVSTALQRGDPALCVDHLILRGGCPRAKDCSKFHLCRKLWQQVQSQLTAGGSIQIRVNAATA